MAVRDSKPVNSFFLHRHLGTDHYFFDARGKLEDLEINCSQRL